MVCVLCFLKDVKAGPLQEMWLYIINEARDHFIFPSAM